MTPNLRATRSRRRPPRISISLIIMRRSSSAVGYLQQQGVYCYRSTTPLGPGGSQAELQLIATPAVFLKRHAAHRPKARRGGIEDIQAFWVQGWVCWPVLICLSRPRGKGTHNICPIRHDAFGVRTILKGFAPSIRFLMPISLLLGFCRRVSK